MELKKYIENVIKCVRILRELHRTTIIKYNDTSTILNCRTVQRDKLSKYRRQRYNESEMLRN